ncbi:MAG: pyridoxal-phosphate dependent enzyme [Planctomycetota bacterium]|nr:pyridoxal-phosphate dependent enzyme [Planctomycetota bacterium]
MSDLPLFEQFPALKERIPRLEIGEFPTPVNPWERIGRRAGIPDLWVKRDDLTAPRFGGNKVRTLEFALARGIESGRPLLVAAPHGSSWAAACAYYGRSLGADVDLVLFRRPSQSEREPNDSIIRAYGRELRSCRTPIGIPLAFAGAWFRGRRLPPLILPIGGASARTALGYASAALELAEQVRSGEMPRPDLIVVPVGSGGTVAGLLAGVALLGWNTLVIGVRVNHLLVANRWSVQRMARNSLRVILRAGKRRRGLPLPEFELEADYFGGEYGLPTEEGREAARLVQEEEGVKLDLTYTGKAVAALLGRAREGRLPGPTVLYWHTFNSRDLTKLL